MTTEQIASTTSASVRLGRDERRQSIVRAAAHAFAGNWLDRGGPERDEDFFLLTTRSLQALVHARAGVAR